MVALSFCIRIVRSQNLICNKHKRITHMKVVLILTGLFLLQKSPHKVYTKPMQGLIFELNPLHKAVYMWNHLN